MGFFFQLLLNGSRHIKHIWVPKMVWFSSLKRDVLSQIIKALYDLESALKINWVERVQEVCSSIWHSLRQIGVHRREIFSIGGNKKLNIKSEGYQDPRRTRCFHQRECNKTQDANCFIGGMLGTSQNVNYYTRGLLRTTEHANYSTWEMLGFTQDANYSIGGMLEIVSMLITLLEGC